MIFRKYINTYINTYATNNNESILINPALDPNDWKKHRFGLSRRRWQQLQGKCFWITGAGSGYGRSIALALTAAGSTTFISGRRQEKLENTLGEGVSLGIQMQHCYPVVADITSQASLRQAFSLVSRHTLSLFGLINCAGIPQKPNQGFPLIDGELISLEDMLQTNIIGQWLICKTAMPLLARGNSFRVLFLSSEAGWADTPGHGPYNISKSALNSLGMSFAAECSKRYSEKDIQINVLDPGEAKTEMNQGSRESPYSVTSMALTLLSHRKGGPNGHFFHRDGRHLGFGQKEAFLSSLLLG